MKFNKLFIAALSFAAIAMVGCNKKNNGGSNVTPTPTPQEEDVEDIPAVSAPDADHMLLLVRVGKDNDICNTIAMRGAMTSYGDGNPILFEKVADTETWYKVTLPIYTNAEFFHCKLMIAGEDGTALYDNEGKAGEYELLNGTEAYLELADDYGTANCLNMLADVDCAGKILYVAIKSFKGNPCVAKSVYKITLKMVYNVDDGYQPAVSGNFNSWGATAMNKVSDAEWNIEVEAQAGNEFKFQSSKGDWSNEIQKYNVDSAKWEKMNNLVLGEDMNPVYDYSNADLYRWSQSVPAEFVDYSEVELELVGDAINEQAGSEADDIWTWGQKLALGKPSKDGNTFTWEKADVSLNAAGGFKVRSKGYAKQGDIDPFDFGKDGGSDNANVEADGMYKITATVDGMTGARNLIITPAN